MSHRVDIDQTALVRAIRGSRGFLMRAAVALGVSRMSLRRRARELGLLGWADDLRRGTGWRRGRPLQ